jgi:hypothetical protein
MTARLHERRRGLQYRAAKAGTSTCKDSLSSMASVEAVDATPFD